MEGLRSIDPAARIPLGSTISALSLSLLSHAVSFVQFSIVFPTLSVPRYWYGDFGFLLALSASVSVVLAFSPPRSLVYWPIRAVQFCLFFMLTYPLGNALSVRLTLVSALVFDVMIRTATPWDILLSTAYIGVSLLIPGKGSAWSAPITAVSPDNAIVMGFYPAVILLVGFSFKRFRGMAIDRKLLIDKLNQTSLRLMDTNVALQERIVTQEAHMLEQERNRISRELHDTVGYTLMNIIALLKASDELSKTDREKAREFISKSIGQAEQGLNETRTALKVLREREIPAVTAISAVRKLVSAFEETNTRVLVDFGNSLESYGPGRDKAIYKFIQEAIANAIKHGNADRIEIYFWRSRASLTVTVRDNGTGIQGEETKTEGIGFKGMRERFAEFRGRVSFMNSPIGFKLTAELPFPEPGEEEDGNG